MKRLLKFSMIGLFLLIVPNGLYAATAIEKDECSYNRRELIRSIETKFDIEIEELIFDCNKFWALVRFNLITSNGLNEESIAKNLGYIYFSSEIKSNLSKVLNISVDKMDELKSAKLQMDQDASLIENESSIVARAAMDEHMIKEVVEYSKSSVVLKAPYCEERYSVSSQILTKVLTPIFTIGSLVQAPEAPLYQKGDLLKAMMASSQFLSELDNRSLSNLKAEEYFQKNYQEHSNCSRRFDGTKYVFLDWNRVRKMFNLVP